VLNRVDDPFAVTSVRRIGDEGAVLRQLVSLYDEGAYQQLSANSFTLKARFVPVYTAFAGDAGLNKLP
jgi:hypothetical protein